MAYFPSPATTISTLNSTKTPLIGGASFVGTWEDITRFPAISVIGGADVAGTLYAEFSDDGTTGSPGYRNVQLTDGKDGSWGIHNLVRVAKFFRITVVNGPVAQASIAVQTIYSATSMVAQPTSRAAQVASDESDVLNVRVLSEVPLDEARGALADRRVIQVHGNAPTIPAGTERVIWSYNAAFTGFLTAASAVRVQAGGNPADTAAGAGAQSIVVEGLDANWNEVSATLVTAGAAASAPSAQTFVRVFRAYVLDAGTYATGSVVGANTGAVVIETTAGAVLCNIVATVGTSQLAAYTVPDGYEAFVRRINASVGGNKSATCYMFERQNADVVAAPFTGRRLVHSWADLSGEAVENFTSYPGPFPARTDLWLTCVGPAGGGAASADFDIVLVAV